MKKIMTAALLACATMSAQSALIDNNDVISGTFLDTDTGLTWLDLGRTGSYSCGYYCNNSYRTLSDVMSTFSDFRVATQSDLSTLMSNAFQSVTFDSNGEYSYRDEWRSSEGGPLSVYDPNFFSDYTNFYTVAGGTNYSSRYGDYSGSTSWGGESALFGYFLGDDGTFDSLKVSQGNGTSQSCTRTWTGGRSCSTTYTSKYSHIDFIDVNGTDSIQGPLWMIYDPEVVDVSEPPAIALLGLGLLAISSIRKKYLSNLHI